jgi:hypothetical protein
VQLDDADAACLPFAHQQLYQHPANTHQQLQQTGLSQHAGSSGRSSSGSLQVQVLLDNSGTPAAATQSALPQRQQLLNAFTAPRGCRSSKRQQLLQHCVCSGHQQHCRSQLSRGWDSSSSSWCHTHRASASA